MNLVTEAYCPCCRQRQKVALRQYETGWEHYCCRCQSVIPNWRIHEEVYPTPKKGEHYVGD